LRGSGGCRVSVSCGHSIVNSTKTLIGLKRVAFGLEGGPAKEPEKVPAAPLTDAERVVMLMHSVEMQIQAGTAG
jgi:hypothetical protein